MIGYGFILFMYGLVSYAVPMFIWYNPFALAIFGVYTTEVSIISIIIGVILMIYGTLKNL